MSAARYVVLRCDGARECVAETHHAYSDCMTAAELRRIRKPDGWHVRPGGSDLCPDCWKAGHR